MNKELAMNDISSAIFRWYPFNKEGSALEIYGDLGEHTGALCEELAHVDCLVESEEKARIIKERYKSYNNLTLINVKARDFKSDKCYDYIIVYKQLEQLDNEEQPALFLKDLSRHLKKNGKLILCVDNKYGVRNLCGKKSATNDIPFGMFMNSGFVGHKDGYSKTEIEDILSAAGFSHYKFYYPVYDDVAPRVIYTDACLPDERIWERYAPCYDGIDTITVNEKNVLKMVMDSGAFAYHSNTFFIELSNSDNLSKIKYATISSNREREQAFAVCICEDNTVYKKCMYKETRDYAQKLCDEMSELENHNIPILPMEYKDGRLNMEYVAAENLQEHIISLIKNKGTKQDIISIFDLLWHYILESSEYVENCSFDTKGLEVGPVLKKAFIEMIPLNSFWVKDDILFYDQEFSKENYPATYTLFRAIFNTYGFSTGLEQIIAQEDLYLRYGITEEIKKLYVEIDNEFSDTVNRPVQILRSFQTSEGRMINNCKNIGSTRYRDFYHLLYEWKQLEPADIENRLLQKGIKSIVIYGEGRHGKLLKADLDKTSISVIGFIDRERMISVDKADAVIISPIDDKEHIRDFLKDKISESIKIISLDDLIFGRL